MATLLLVDSDDKTRDILRTAAESRGQRVSEAASGVDGLRITALERPEVIIGDFPMNVPDRSPFTRAARQQGRHNALIASFSARALEDQVAAAEAVSDAVFTKPQPPMNVVERVEQLIEGRS